jgi:transposase-like protein
MARGKEGEAAGQGGLIKQLAGKMLQRTLEAEMAGHLGHEKNSSAGGSRNGHAEKTALLENQKATVEVPRGRNGTFEPIIVPKHEKRLPVFNGQIISMYSFGMPGGTSNHALKKYTTRKRRLI